MEMKLAAGRAIAGLVTDNELSPSYILPNALDIRVPVTVAREVAAEAMRTG